MHPRIGVGVLILDSQNKLLLGRRISSHGCGTWAPVGGHLECGESIEECARREAMEEVGLEITHPAFLCITNDIFDSDKHYISIFMTTRIANRDDLINKEPNKVLEWKWFDIDNLPDSLFLPLHNLLSNNQYGQDLSYIAQKSNAKGNI